MKNATNPESEELKEIDEFTAKQNPTVLIPADKSFKDWFKEI